MKSLISNHIIPGHVTMSIFRKCHGLVAYRRLQTAQIERPTVLSQLVRALDYRCTLKFVAAENNSQFRIMGSTGIVVRPLTIE